MKNNFKYLFKILIQYDFTILLLFMLCVLTEMLLPYIGILLPRFVIQAIITYADWNQWICILGIFGIGGGAVYIIDTLCNSRLKTHISVARNCCFGDMLNWKMMKIRYELLEQPHIQELCFRANMLFWSETSGVMGALTNMKSLLANFLVLAGMTVILAKLHFALPLVLFFSTALDIYLLKKAKEKEAALHPVNAEKEREKDYIDKTMRNIDYGRDIRIYHLAELLDNRYQRVSAEQESIVKKIQKQYRMAKLGTSLISIVRDIVVYGMLIFAVVNHLLGIDEFVMYLSCVTAYSGLFIHMVDEFLNIKQYLGFTEDFRKAMELEEDIQEKKPETQERIEHIHLSNVTYYYPDSNKPALNQVEFTIKRGEHIMIAGANGAGKTTLIKLLTGLYEPTEGKIEISTSDGKSVEIPKRYALFSTVMQKIYQYAFSVEENVAFKESGKCDSVRVREALENAGLIEVIDKLPKGMNTNLRKDFDPEGVELSGGQAQLLALARTLYKDAPIVVLDEPTASLDPIAEAELYGAFQRLFPDKICIFISHRLSSAVFCDRVILMENGEIISSGTHEELLKTSELYEKMWEAQSRPYKRKQESGNG